MAKREQILRIMLIAELLKRKPKGITYQEAKNYLETKFEEKDLLSELKFSEKTFSRDRKMISEILGIESGFKRSTGNFQVIDEELEIETENVFDNILLIDAYRQNKGNSEIMLFEKRKSRGLEHLNGILHAIQNRIIISVQYTKYWEESPQKRILEPYALKEFKYRWYLLANEKNDKGFFVKTFGLDRITDLEITKSTFKKENFDATKIFQNSFGIISTLGQSPEEIILSFTKYQGKYIKSLPIHTSQEILIDNETELRIKLNLVPTFDFKQEILSYGENVIVISPRNFHNEMKLELEKLKLLYR